MLPAEQETTEKGKSKVVLKFLPMHTQQKRGTYNGGNGIFSFKL